MVAPSPIPSPVPHGRTARRLEWAHLPPVVRRLVERRCGSPVVEARSRGAGFSPALAAVLVCADGSRHFLQAASRRAQRAFAAAYEAEERVLEALPATAPAPRLRWSLADDDWVLLGVEHVDARPPTRPWLPDDLDRGLAAVAGLATALTPAPPGLALATFGEELAGWPGCWDHVRRAHPDLAPAAHLDEAAALAAGFAEACAGETVVHTDVRADNLLLCADGRTLLCDWSWPLVGAAWIDTVMLLLEARGDGVDVDPLLVTSPRTRDVPPDHVDALLALLAGYHLRSGDARVPSSSPWVRAHQQHTGAVAWAWLADRRGWS